METIYRKGGNVENKDYFAIILETELADKEAINSILYESEELTRKATEEFREVAYVVKLQFIAKYI